MTTVAEAANEYLDEHLADAIAKYRAAHTSGGTLDESKRLTPHELAEAGFARAQKAMAVRLAKISRGEDVREQ